jgi:hypothetical protein
MDWPFVLIVLWRRLLSGCDDAVRKRKKEMRNGRNSLK